MRFNSLTLVVIILGGIVWSTQLFAQDDPALQTNIETQIDTIAVVDFGVTIAQYKNEASRIPDLLRPMLEEQAAVFVLDMDAVADRLMESSTVVNTFSTDSSYWNTVGKSTNASVIIHGIVKPQNDSVIIVDLFVSDLTQKTNYKTAVLYNPTMEDDSLLLMTLQHVVNDVVMYGRTKDATTATTESDAVIDSTEPDSAVSQPETASVQSTVLWLIEGAALVAATITIITLLNESVDPEANNLPGPPQFP